VIVEYKDFITQIRLDENYPNATHNVRIGVFNCDGKYSFLFSNVFVFV
jgi:hypothetical protein